MIHYWGAASKLLSNHHHKHSFFELCYCVDGKGIYLEGGLSTEILPGVLFCSKPGVYHQILSESQSDLHLLFIAFEIVEDVGTGSRLASLYKQMSYEEKMLLVQAEHSASSSLWLTLLDQVAPGKPIFPDLLKSIAYSLLVSIPPHYLDATQVMPTELSTRTPSSMLVKQATLFVRDNLGEKLLARHVANYLHISERHLARIFQGEFGETFGSYLRKERVNLAAELLNSHQFSIKEIAERTGFGTVHYFTRVFSEEIGMTPARYRRNAAREQ
ncbi:AraC family transcriptional regulator [Paenibacillus oryzisoli]|uniref:helix-turn-helix domain-containing protein n=1 Tax=Paenibacillus oryzisoli TaxID=1850517 RepID=UPI003D26D2B1